MVGCFFSYLSGFSVDWSANIQKISRLKKLADEQKQNFKTGLKKRKQAHVIAYNLGRQPFQL